MVKEIDVSEIFAPFGQIENIKILPSKNCAFVKYMDIESAVRAFNQMANGAVIRGQPIKVGWGKVKTKKKKTKNQNNLNFFFFFDKRLNLQLLTKKKL